MLGSKHTSCDDGGRDDGATWASVFCSNDDIENNDVDNDGALDNDRVVDVFPVQGFVLGFSFSGRALPLDWLSALRDVGTFFDVICNALRS